jgi:dipeptidyl aminopeptidase/acylaminoacyl peptidase
MRTILLLFLAGLLAPVLAAEEQQLTIRPNENLVVDGIPPIPAAIMERAAKYTEYRAASFASWVPGKREMLILTRFADTPQVHLVRFPGGARKQLTFFPDRVANARFPEEPADYFVLNKDVGGSEFYQNYRFDLKSGDVTLLTDGKSRNEAGVWSHHGKLLAYTSTRRNSKDSDLYVIENADKTTDHLLAQVEGAGWEPVDWSPDNTTLLVRQEISINETNLFLVDASSGRMTRLNRTGQRAAYNGGQFAKEGIYIISDSGSEFRTLGLFDPKTKEFKSLTPDIPWNVDLMQLSPDGSKVAFVTNEDGISRVYLLDTASGKYRLLDGLPVGVIGDIEWNSNGQDLEFTIGSYNASSDVFSVDVNSGKVDRWTESETGGIDPNHFAKPEVVKWPTFDGRQISGFLYRPPASGGQKLPVIINIHGGPEAQFRPSYLGRTNYFLNELGVAIIFPNVRGSDGYGKAFLDLDNGEKREDSVKDIGALLDWIKTRPDLDADRIMITGGSYGGYMTLSCSFHYADRIRCSLDVVGISNFVTFLEKTEAYRRDLRRVEYGDERDPKMREFLLRISPLNHVQEITKPIFIVAGQNDPRVPVNEGQQMVNALKQRGQTVWYLVGKNEGHGFSKKANADFQFYATVKFVEDQLLK